MHLILFFFHFTPQVVVLLLCVNLFTLQNSEWISLLNIALQAQLCLVVKAFCFPSYQTKRKLKKIFAD